MKSNQTIVATALLLGLLCAFGARHAMRSPAEDEKTLTVQLCDGATKTTFVASGEPTADDGRAIASQLMAQWLVKNPKAEWESASAGGGTGGAAPPAPDVKPAHSVVRPEPNQNLLGAGQSDGNTYRAVTPTDLLTWETESYAFAQKGADVFHDSKQLGSTIAVSCDMCHPDASNTHPETYPKFQSQLGKVALLRDMINWCIQHPVRGVKLEADDPRMRALEAYILAQRKGKALDYGRH